MNDTETKILLWIQKEVRRRYVTPFFQLVTHSVDGGAIWLLISSGLLLSKKTRNAGMGALSAIAVNALVVNLLLKNLVVRDRPFKKEESLTPLCRYPKDNSFPSGHTAVSFAAASHWLGSGYKKLGTAALVYATLVGLSRVYVGVHYPTDVLAGALVGSVIGLLTGSSKRKKR